MAAVDIVSMKTMELFRFVYVIYLTYEQNVDEIRVQRQQLFHDRLDEETQ